MRYEDLVEEITSTETRRRFKEEGLCGFTIPEDEDCYIEFIIPEKHLDEEEEIRERLHVINHGFYKVIGITLTPKQDQWWVRIKNRIGETVKLGYDCCFYPPADIGEGFKPVYQ